MDLAYERISVQGDDACKTARARAPAREEGILGGILSGANVFAALVLAQKPGPNRRIVTVTMDSGLKDLKKGLFTDHPLTVELPGV
jgi:cysteine synthase A